MSNNNVNEKLDRIIEDITEIKVTLAKHDVFHERNTDSLEHHIKRTDLLEKSHNRFAGAVAAATTIGALIYALHSMGILQKLLS